MYLPDYRTVVAITGLRKPVYYIYSTRLKELSGKYGISSFSSWISTDQRVIGPLDEYYLKGFTVRDPDSVSKT